MDGIILIGRPGSGKSSIGKHIAKTFDMDYISSGDIARKMAENNNAITAMLNSGKLAPEDEMRSAIFHELSLVVNAKRMFVLDGFPRNIAQFNIISKLYKLIYIHVFTDTRICIHRIGLRNREGDTTSLNERMDYYNTRTKAILDHVDKFITVNNNSYDQMGAIQYVVNELDEILEYYLPYNNSGGQ